MGLHISFGRYQDPCSDTISSKNPGATVPASSTTAERGNLLSAAWRCRNGKGSVLD